MEPQLASIYVEPLAERDGYLWGRLPVRALWLWGALVASRVLLTVVAHGLNAFGIDAVDGEAGGGEGDAQRLQADWARSGMARSHR